MSARTVSKRWSRSDTGDPDVVILDIEMPELDGIATLKELLKRRPGLPVIMASTMTKRGAEITLKALHWVPRLSAEAGWQSCG